MTLPHQVQQLLTMDAASAKKLLGKISSEELLAPAKIVSREDALLVKAAIYLKHGFLDESHKISQQVETPNGSYWHAIMHRKEGDFGNSKYWYRRVGAHAVLATMGEKWDALRFVDQCARGTAPDALERKEFDLLLQHTIRCATFTQP